MPLPDAEPKPNKANIYEQFSHIEVQDFTRDNLDVVRKPLNLNSESEDVLRRIKLVGEVSNQLSSSGPIPGTSKLVKVVATDTNKTLMFTPQKGEVWQLLGATVLANTGPGLTNTYYLYLRHEVDGTTDTFDVYLGAESSGSTLVSLSEWFQDIGGNGTFTIDNKSSLYVEVSDMGTASNFEFYILMTRVR